MTDTFEHHHCPICGRVLKLTDEGLWCENGCFRSCYELHKLMALREKERDAFLKDMRKRRIL